MFIKYVLDVSWRAIGGSKIRKAFKNACFVIIWSINVRFLESIDNLRNSVLQIIDVLMFQ